MRLIPLSVLKKRSLETMQKLQYGEFTLTTPEGEVIRAKGMYPGPVADLTLHNWSVVEGLLLHGDIAMGEDYIAGLWDSSDIEALFTLFLTNYDQFKPYAFGSKLSQLAFMFFNRFIRRNNKYGSKKNIQAHYDVGNDFYRLWLDSSMTYSSALFHNTQQLEEAQRSKYQRILSNIDGDASSVLEIGCGWGGFAEEAVKSIPNVTGLTISAAQHRYASERLGSNVDVRLQDYREVTGKFDAIVSIEMLEAVGEAYWPKYFATVTDRLKKGGKAVIQTITMRDDAFEEYRASSDFIRHYVFPGGMLPSVKRFREEAQRASLKCMDVFQFGQHYAQTLRTWLERFEARKSDIRNLGYSEAFIRNWRFYLAICAAAFKTGRTDVMQVQLCHA